jgi:class 3 adenylate cyclase
LQVEHGGRTDEVEEGGGGTTPRPEARVGHELRRAREAKRLSLRELARRLQRSHSNLWEYERGHRFPSAEIVREYAHELHIDSGQLLSIWEEARVELFGEDRVRRRRFVSSANNDSLNTAPSDAADEVSDSAPSGPGRVVTFVLSDIEGSTALWERFPELMPAILVRHDRLIDDAVRRFHGSLRRARGEGDSTISVFERAADAIDAAVAIQRAIAAEPWPLPTQLSIRLAISTGASHAWGGEHFGPAANRAGRLRALARGGQTLVDGHSVDLVGDTIPTGSVLVDLGLHKLRGIATPEPIFELRVELPASISVSSTSHDRGPRVEHVDLSNLEWASLSRAPFVGRKAVLETIRGLSEEADQGNRILVVVTGEPGIGKTHLAAAAARRAREAGALVLYGYSDEEPLAPFQAFRQALRWYAQRAPSARLQMEIPEHSRALLRLVPELTAILGVLPPEGDYEVERYRLFEAVDGWFASMAESQPVLLVLDDVHWADEPTLLLLRHLARSTSRSRLMIIALCRDDEPVHRAKVRGLLANAVRAGRVEHLSLEGFATDESLALFESFAGRSGHTVGRQEAALAERLCRETRGNPFFLREVLRHLVETGVISEVGGRWTVRTDIAQLAVPDTVRDVIAERTARLSVAAQAVLPLAAVAGNEFYEDVVVASQGLDPEEVAVALEEASAARLLMESEAPGQWRFAHALVRQSLYEELSRTRRSRLHRRVAVILQAKFHDCVAAHAAELAFHYAEGAAAGSAAEALVFARMAGEGATAEAAYEAAAGHYAKALDVLSRYGGNEAGDRADLLLALGTACNRAGDVAKGQVAFLEAASIARTLGHDDLLAEAALGYGGVLPASPDPMDMRGQRLLEEALARLESNESAPRALVTARLAHWTYWSSPRSRRADMCQQAQLMARQVGDLRTLAEVLASSYWALDGPDELDRQQRVGQEIEELGRRVGDVDIALQGLKCRLHAMLALGDHPAADSVAAQLGSLAKTARQPEYLRFVPIYQARSAVLQGAFDDAERLATEATTLMGVTGHADAVRVRLAQLLPLRWFVGTMPTLESAVTRLLTRSPHRLVLRTALAWILAESGDVEGARRQLGDLDATVFDGDHSFDFWSVLAATAIVAERLDDANWAKVVYEAGKPYASCNCIAGQTAFYGAAAHHLGVMATLLGNHDDAVEHLAFALDRHRAMVARPWIALTQVAMARTLRARGAVGDDAEAREMIAAASSVATELPASPVARLIQSLTDGHRETR